MEDTVSGDAELKEALGKLNIRDMRQHAQRAYDQLSSQVKDIEKWSMQNHVENENRLMHSHETVLTAVDSAMKAADKGKDYWKEASTAKKAAKALFDLFKLGRLFYSFFFNVFFIFEIFQIIVYFHVVLLSVAKLFHSHFSVSINLYFHF